MNPKSISRPEIALHWIVAIGVIGMIAVGQYMHHFEVRSLVGIHKSIGALLLIIILARVILRWRKGWPENISQGPAWQHRLARVVHWVLILGPIAMVGSGINGSIMGGRGLYIFGLEIISANLGANGRPIPINLEVAKAAGMAHAIIGKILLAAIVLHIAGALKHHLLDKDNTLKRMLGKV